MCGISAISLNSALPEQVTQILQRMNAAQIARGPNGSGVAVSGAAGVGMVRLRVRADQLEPEPIPLGPTHTAAYNGEVYWHDNSAPTGGQGEVTALCQNIDNTVDGMYALAVLDHTSQGIDLSRDQFGIKPMWMRKVVGGTAVASTIDSLLHGFGPDNARFEGIQQFLAFGRPIDGGSFFEDIASVPRGSKGILKDGVFTQASRTQLELGHDGCKPQELRAALQDSIRRVLPSNQTMGLAVSGGLDSTILAHQMAALGIEDLRTVSVLVDGVEDGVADLSQLKIPGSAARSWVHSTVTVTPEMFAKGFERAAHDLGEPTRLSSVPLYGALADVAQEAGIVVLQVGEGADELFMGYSSYRNVNTEQPDFPFRFILPDNKHQYLEALYGEGVINTCRTVYDNAYPMTGTTSGMEHLRRIELDHSLEPLLRRADQLLMARSIEGRTPFLQGTVPQLALSVPAYQHLANDRSKPLLRAAFPELDLLEGPWRIKTPFRAPIAHWLQTSLSPWMERVLDDGTPVLRAFGLREEGIALVRKDARAGKAVALDMVLALMSLVFWSEWLEQERPLYGT